MTPAAGDNAVIPILIPPAAAAAGK